MAKITIVPVVANKIVRNGSVVTVKYNQIVPVGVRINIVPEGIETNTISADIKFTFTSPGISITKEKHITRAGTYYVGTKYKERRNLGTYNAFIRAKVEGTIMVLAPMGVSMLYKNINVPFKIKVEPPEAGGIPPTLPPRWKIR